MRRLLYIVVPLAALSAGVVVAASHEHVVDQKDKAFSLSSLKIHVGDTVSFRNDDPFFHNIFSLSETQPFDLGSYAKGQARKMTFTKEGAIDVECAIHPDMKMKIQVEK